MNLEDLKREDRVYRFQEVQEYRAKLETALKLPIYIVLPESRIRIKGQIQKCLEMIDQILKETDGVILR